MKQATPASVAIEVGGQTITFEGEKVRAIYFGAPPTSSMGPELTPSMEAIRALKALRSVTTSGVSYREYAPRVLDTKVLVDRYLQSPAANDSEARKALGASMSYYEYVARAWSINISRGDYASVAVDPRLSECAAAANAVSQYASRVLRRSDALAMGVAIQEGFPALWSCASDKLAEAEKLLAGEKR